MVRRSEGLAGMLDAQRAPAQADEEAALRHSFGMAVRRLRASRGLSQERLAAKAELNRSYMGEIERAAVMPSLATAAKLARALDVPLWLLIQHSERRSPDLDGRS